MGRKSRQNLQEINWNVLVRASQTFAWMQELRAKGHLTGYSLDVTLYLYYIYQCDLSLGLEHFRTPVSKGIEIIEGLRAHNVPALYML